MDEDKNKIKKQKIAVVRIRGSIRLNPKIKKTLSLLKLYKKNYCVVYDITESILGMIHTVKDFVTWGEINDDVLNMLMKKRKEIINDKNGKRVEKKFYRLHPPLKGFERKGIKKAYSEGGALGYRKDAINDLIMRML